MSGTRRTQWASDGVPALVIACALLLAPIYGWLAAIAARRAYADAPPPCYGLGFGCDLSPGTVGYITAILYGLVLCALALVVGVLHLGRRRLAVARSVVAIAGVTLLWAWMLVAIVAS